MLAARTAGSDEQIPCPDLLILDLGLPRVDGLEVLRAFRNNKHCASTPVIIFSASIAPEHRNAVQNFEDVRFIPKPMDLDEFMDFGRTVKNMLMRAENA